jgi:hypothetical protein
MVIGLSAITRMSLRLDIIERQLSQIIQYLQLIVNYLLNGGRTR